MACYGENLASVHFHSYEPDFGTPIRRTPTGFWDSGLWNRSDRYAFDRKRDRYPDRCYAAIESARIDSNYRYEDGDSELKKRFSVLYNNAKVQVQTAHWRRARQIYLTIQAKKGRWTGELRDRVDLLTSVLAMRHVTPSQITAVKQYNGAIDQGLTGNWKLSNKILSGLSGAAGATFLKDRICYRQACNAYEANNSAEAIGLFQKCANGYPHSPMRESAFIMIARESILQDWPSQKMLEMGQAAIRQLLSSYPHTRFYLSTLGLRARVHFLQKRYSDALWCYYQLGDLESVLEVDKTLPNGLTGDGAVILMEAYLRRIRDDAPADPDADARNVRQINKLRSRLSLSLIHRFSEDLKSSPSLLVAYIYYRLYYTNTRFQDLANLSDMARSALKRSPYTAMSPMVEVRLAEAEYQQRHYAQCIEWTSRALKTKSDYDRALFMRASAEAKSHHASAAHADLVKAMNVSTDNAIRQSARQLLALVCEELGHLAEALDQYNALGYSIDIAYLLDVRMSPHQIEACLRAFRDDRVDATLGFDYPPNKSIKISYTRRQMLTYALGIRYMRLERWRDAERCFASLPADLLNAFDVERREHTDDPCPGVVKAVRELARLKGAIGRSHGYEARAAAAYRYASYYHNNSDLLLYNVMLWKGERVVNFEIFWNTRAQSDADTFAIRNYMKEHDVFLRSRELCLDIAAHFPNSKIAPNAIYRAACASYRVGALSWWFQRNTAGFRYKPAGEPAALMNRLVNHYPKSSLVASASKYGRVFAMDSRRATWPHYAAEYRQRGRPTDDKIKTEVVDAERLLAMQ